MIKASRTASSGSAGLLGGHRSRLALVLLAITLGLAACATPPPPPMPPQPPPLSTYQPIPSGYAPGSTIYVAVARLNLRACPGTNCQILAGLSRGVAMTVISQEGGWFLVRTLATGREGWVGGRYVSAQPMSRPRAPRKTAPPAQSPAEQPPAEQTPASPPPAEEWAEPSGEQAPNVPVEAPPPSAPAPVQEEFAPTPPK